MSKLRVEYILRALKPEVNLSELCQEYEIGQNDRPQVASALQRGRH